MTKPNLQILEKIRIFKPVKLNLFTKLIILITVLLSTVSMTLFINYQKVNADMTITTNKNINASDKTYDNQDVVIDGAVVTIYGHHDFKSLTIKNNGKLTHDEISGNDANTASEKNKKIDLTIEGDLILDSGGSIDASGVGFSGVNYTESKGHGPGGSASQSRKEINGYPQSSSAGGAGGFSRGGTGKDYGFKANDIDVRYGGSSYMVKSDPPSNLPVGSGGGGAAITSRFGSDNPATAQSVGGNGGGRISLQVGNAIQILNTKSKIAANGMDSQGVGFKNLAYGGGGSGGYISVSANKFVYNYMAYSNMSIGGGYGTTGSGGNGSSYFSGPGNVSSYKNISANGGSSKLSAGYGYNLNDIYQRKWCGVTYGCGGGGSGGIVVVNVTEGISYNCNIFSGIDYIPANCENKDVVINNTSVYADKIILSKTWVPQVADIDPDPSKTDPTIRNKTPEGSKYKFEKLIIKNCPPAIPSNINDPKCDSKRTFKSLTITGSNGKLTHQAVTVADMAQDITGGNKSLADETTGTARWKKVDIDVVGTITLSGNAIINADGLGYLGGQGNDQDGYGPGGGGHGHADITEVYANGGSYGGQGGEGGNAGSASSNYGDKNYPIDFGSGGGHAYNTKGAGNASQPGGNGGGRIFLEAGELNINLGSRISADGTKGGWINHCTGFIVKKCKYAGGGGGSGGSIIIKAVLSGRNTAFAAEGVTNNQEGDGSVMPDDHPDGDAITARGGNSTGHDNGGGGGRILFGTKGPTVTLNFKKSTNTSESFQAEEGAKIWLSGEKIVSTDPDCSTPSHTVTSTETDLTSYTFTGLKFCKYSAYYDSTNSEGALNLGNISVNINYSFDIIIYPKSKIIGDVHGKTKVNTNAFKIDGKAVVASKGSIDTICSKTGEVEDCRQLTGYNLAAAETDITSIETRLKEYAQKDASGSGYASPILSNLNPNNTPEGGVWIKSSDLTLSDAGGLRYTGRGTVIVEGDLTIDTNLQKNASSNLGYVVLGDVKITKNVHFLDAAIYAKGKIDLTAIENFAFNGFLVSLFKPAAGSTEVSINLPFVGRGSTIAYDATLAKTPILPGFSKIMSLTISNTAP